MRDFPDLAEVADAPSTELRSLLIDTEEAIESMKLQIKVRRDLGTADKNWLDRISTASYFAHQAKNAILKRLENVARSPSA